MRDRDQKRVLLLKGHTIEGVCKRRGLLRREAC